MSHSTGIPTVGIASWDSIGTLLVKTLVNEIGDFLKRDDIF